MGAAGQLGSESLLWATKEAPEDSRTARHNLSAHSAAATAHILAEPAQRYWAAAQDGRETGQEALQEEATHVCSQSAGAAVCRRA